MNIFHGKVISLDDQDRIYQYLVEDQGRIVYLGDDLPPEYKNGKSQIELGDQVLIPAFGDGHLHFSTWAMFAASYFDVREARDIPEIQEIIRKFIGQNLKTQRKRKTTDYQDRTGSGLPGYPHVTGLL